MPWFCLVCGHVSSEYATLEDYSETSPDVTAVGTLVEVKDPKALRARSAAVLSMHGDAIMLSVPAARGRLMELESHAKRQILQGIPGRHGSWTRLNERGLRAGMLAEEQLCYAEDVIMCDLAPTLEAVLSGHGLSGTSEHRSRLVQVQVQTPFCLWLEFPAVHRHPPAGFARVDSLPSCAPRPT